jgi:hypothetical protein
MRNLHSSATTVSASSIQWCLSWKGAQHNDIQVCCKVRRFCQQLIIQHGIWSLLPTHGTYLQFFNSKSTTSTNTSMILECWAVHDWSQGPSNWTWCDSKSFLLPIVTATLLTSWLIKPATNPTLPVLVKVTIRNHIIPLAHLAGSTTLIQWQLKICDNNWTNSSTISWIRLTTTVRSILLLYMPQ